MADDKLTDEQKLQNEKIDSFAKTTFNGKYQLYAEQAKAFGYTYEQFIVNLFDKVTEGYDGVAFKIKSPIP
jgi:hypothetical protein